MQPGHRDIIAYRRAENYRYRRSTVILLDESTLRM